MKTLAEYIEKDQEITYEQYSNMINCIAQNRVDENIYYMTDKLTKIYRRAERDFKRIKKMSNLSMAAITMAFLNPDVYNIWRAFKYSFSFIYDAVFEFAKLVKFGLFDALQDISNNKLVEKLEKGIVKADDLIRQYPVLKDLSGVALAGMMIYMWLNMTFIGNFKYDMNLKNVAKALSGSYTFADFIQSMDGKSMLVLFSTGAIISFPWLGITLGNLVLALMYTGLMTAGETELAKKIKEKIKTTFKIK